MLISIPITHASWRSNSRKRNPLQHMSSQFKTESKRCNFTNDAATIRIFIKGLKNAHSLATCIYEKGPQMLTDAISEVEKLNAVQQLTATIIPPSMVNVMSQEEDCCFQCQEQGHIGMIISLILDVT